ncbi:MAG: methyltransferase domain-containing protein [Chloroflexi bacterium]|nr:methyltransferase domain-containing protein [Chloroflexota bacterium]
MSKKQVQHQFGRAAADYAVSGVHAQGASLPRMVELAQPQLDWRVLDVATGAGHTALAFAPRVAQVIASDITPEMLAQTAQLAQERGVDNLAIEMAEAQSLPFDNRQFDLVTCRLAAHHFPNIPQFVAEAARVLRPDGLLAVADNIAPGSRLRGKKARLLREAARYLNAYEKLRDPSHGRLFSLPEWEDAYREAGFQLIGQETIPMWLDFDDYVTRMRVSPENRIRLRAMLLQAPQAAVDFLSPQVAGDRITFRFTEAILVGRLTIDD